MLNKALPEQCLLPYLSSVFTTRSRADNTEVYIGSCLEREMADGWYGEWTDWRNDSQQQAPKEPPKKMLGVMTGDVASQVHRARHPTASYAPEPSTASCLHASVTVLTD